MNGIIRVFPCRTSYTPDDDYAFVGMPPMIIPPHEEVHISCAFSWDKKACEELAFQWEGRTDKPVRIGGPAYGSRVDGFTPGMYVRAGITFTSRGCNNNCPWCGVPSHEGKLQELPIVPGNIIQDNNFLQCSRDHKDNVFEMLRSQKSICFRGGLEPDLVDDHFISNIKNLKIKELWLACDTDARFPLFSAACEKLRNAGFSREKIHCYVLSYGKDRDADEARAQAVYRAGAMPFVQLYRDFSEQKTRYDADWNAWMRSWQRPAAIRQHMELGTDYKNIRGEATGGLHMTHSATCIKSFPACICNRCANEDTRRMKPCCGLHGVRCNGNQECKEFKEEEQEHD